MVAAALAAVRFEDPEHFKLLDEYLGDDATILRSLTDASVIVGTVKNNNIVPLIDPIKRWLACRSEKDRPGLLGHLLEYMERQSRLTDNELNSQITIAIVLAEFIDKVGRRQLLGEREPNDLVRLLCQVNAMSKEARDAILQILGRIQVFTRDVGDFLAAYILDPVLQVASHTRVLDVMADFKVFEKGSLDWLTTALSNESTMLACLAARLLGQLGIQSSEELGTDQRRQVADVIFDLLHRPVSSRIVYDMSSESNRLQVGPLYDTLFQSLSQIVTGDAMKDREDSPTPDEPYRIE